jgi:hypothetical protein
MNGEEQRRIYSKMSTTVVSQQCYCRSFLFSGFLKNLYNIYVILKNKQTMFRYVAQADPELEIFLLPQPPKYWDHRHEPPRLAVIVL